MKSQTIKDLYYVFFGKLSFITYCRHRFFRQGRFKDALLNIGCGPKYIEGMMNVDGNIFRKKDLWLDVTLGLPFLTNSIRGIYASHVMEHFKIAEVRKLLREFHRVLKTGGTLRIVVPSLDYAVKAFAANDTSKFPDWPEKFLSVGGRFNNFLLCSNQHRIMFDFSFLQELLNEAGFTSVEDASPYRSRCFSSKQLEFESDPALLEKSIYVEALK
ncbi:MAG: methyltransferase domain-containing protein [Acidobacteria bacterium]|nr:methyltransferase domain-containing protein [Acidobacteriota bacterium]